MEIRIPMVTKPGIPNVNKVIYTEEAWERIVAQVENTDRPIPVTDINYGCNNKSVFVPLKNTLGTVKGFGDGGQGSVSVDTSKLAINKETGTLSGATVTTTNADGTSSKKPVPSV